MADPIIAVLQAVPGLLNLAERIAGAAEATQRNAQLLEFQKALIGLNSLVASVQLENATLRHQKGEAEDALRRMKDWEGEKKRYKLRCPRKGSAVYALQKAVSDGEPPHYLCPNCFKSGKPSLLSWLPPPPKGLGRLYLWTCPNCEFRAETGYAGPSEASYAEDMEQA